ncbi:hypothetical protein B0T26DRAFT_717781 [Lasiosphaeria miniovina]|uniref:HTH psq-type domain-containing protein n=1 Tax=Lasiosphaeria miniovina TaxID=1954250 RepID=A0AA40AD37_9PEZI|nr:uncharacterized protein B0T26DRAFT_717781 [Lasiosphaeria miniovina]KAK0713559.1 hypothetical protein B0T26DRAFT_717781 [Lasiosphaeria miniovina]
MNPGSLNDVESRVASAATWFNEGYCDSVSAAARKFGVPRARLRYRLEGRQPRKVALPPIRP